MPNLLPLARRVLLGLAAALLLSSSAPAGAGALVQAVDSITLTVSDLERALPSYKEVLNFEKVSDVEVAGEGYEHLAGTFGLRMRVVRLRLGDEHIELMQVLAPEGRPIPADSRSNDRWFQHIAMITRDMDRAYGWLRRHKVRHASPGPQRLPDWNPDAGGIEAFYFKDPDGNHLEVLEFPEGKGDPKWHRPGDELFLGIDHTAVVVGDTDSSLAFYPDALGLEVAGDGEITLKGGRVEQGNSDTYQLLRINEAPVIEVHIVRSSEPPGGMGEPGTSAIAPAITNAIFAATGKRVRKLPVDTTALKQAL